MLMTIASNIMPRTTVNLDAGVLRALRRRAAEEGKSLGDVISEVVAPALASGDRPARAPRLRWHTASMGPAKVDLEDKEAVRGALGNA
jgi:plasmid stability protein